MTMAVMTQLHVGTTKSVLAPPPRWCWCWYWCCFSSFASASHSPPLPLPEDEQDEAILATLSQAIRSSPTKPLLHSSLGKLLPRLRLTPSHVIHLINLNPHSLPPLSLLSFFHFLSSHRRTLLTLASYSTMAHFLIAHKMFPHARSLLHSLASRKGKGSASSLFTSLIETETKATHHSHFAFDSLIIAFTDLGFVSDAIQCFRLIRRHKLKLPFQGCQYLLDKMARTSPPLVSFGFYSEILDYGFSPNVRVFNVLMHKFCRQGQIENAQLLFDEISQRGLSPTIVNFNILINGYC